MFTAPFIFVIYKLSLIVFVLSNERELSTRFIPRTMSSLSTEQFIPNAMSAYRFHEQHNHDDLMVNNILCPIVADEYVHREGIQKQSRRRFNIPNPNVISPFIRTILSVFINDQDVLMVTAKYLSVLLWVYVLLSILGTVGIDTKPLLSLLSVVGLTVGLASKDILTNTFAGLLIIFSAPFKRGWTISVEGIYSMV